MLNRLNVHTFAFALLAVLSAAAHAQSTPEAAIRTFMDGFNSGDMAKSAAINSPSGTSIIDEFTPYTWNGPKAFDDWSAAFDADCKAQGITEAKVTLGAPIVKSISSDTAYLTYPSLYTYKLQRTSMRETGRVAFALRKEDSAWKIAAWTWAGTLPKPAK